MFSSTTIASSITTPTISTSASIVTLFSVKPSAHIAREGRDHAGRDGHRAISVARQLRMNSEHDERGEDRCRARGAG
jgi:hypothetical protein